MGQDATHYGCLGATVEALRIQKGLSRRQLANKCNPSLDYGTIRRVELGQGFTQRTLETLALALDVDLVILACSPGIALPLSILPLHFQKGVLSMAQDKMISAAKDAIECFFRGATGVSKMKRAKMI